MALDQPTGRMVAEAAAILDGAAKQFIAGHRADSAVAKKGNDFATEVDLAIERQVVAELTRRPESACTARSSAGSRIDSRAGVGAGPDRRHVQLRGRVADGRDAAGPAARRRTGAGPDLAAVHRSALHGDARRAAAVQRWRGAALGRRPVGLIVGIGTFNIDSRGAFPGRYRFAVLEV